MEIVRSRESRQAGEKSATVRTRREARIAQDEHAAVMDIADESTSTLLERDDGIRNLPLDERVETCIAQGGETRIEYRIIRRGEGQFVDDHDTERLAGNIDAFPEACGTEQHAVAGFTKTAEQLVTGRRALHEQGKGQSPFEQFSSSA